MVVLVLVYCCWFKLVKLVGIITTTAGLKLLLVAVGSAISQGLRRNARQVKWM